MKWIILIMVVLIIAGCQEKSSIGQNENVPVSPCSRVNFGDVITYTNQVNIQSSDIVKGKVAGTGSMLPAISPSATVLYKKTNNVDDLCLGDIVVYDKTQCNPNGISNTTIHRIVSKDIDDIGIYYTVKGDNNKAIDNCKIRLDDIKLVVVGILY